MSDFEYEYEPGEVVYVDAVEELASARDDSGPVVPENAVTARMFHPDGSPREEPPEDAGPALWGAYIDQLEAEEVPDPPPDERPLSSEQWQFDYEQRSRAVAEAEAAQNQAERISFVENRARAFGVRDPEALARVDQQVLAAQDYLYKQAMASGFTEAQAREWLASRDYDAAVDVALEQERYLAVTANTKVGQWRRQREARNELNARMGQPLEEQAGAKSIARMRERALEHAERAGAFDREVKARMWARTGQNPATPPRDAQGRFR